MLEPGPETKLVDKFTKSARWEGIMPAGALGRDAPALPARGSMNCRWCVNDLWLVCEIEDRMGTGPDAHVWKAVWVSGWDFGHREYRGAIFDSFGNTSMMRGRIEGEKLVFESMTDVVLHGQATRLRFTFDAGASAQGVEFTAEHSVGGVFCVDERQLHVPVG